MTGIFMRVQRDGKWLNLEIERMTEVEIRERFKDKPEQAMSFFVAVCKRMAEVEDQYFEPENA